MVWRRSSLGFPVTLIVSACDWLKFDVILYAPMSQVTTLL